VVPRRHRNEVLSGKHVLSHSLFYGRAALQRAIGPDEMVRTTVTAVDEDIVLPCGKHLFWRECLERAVSPQPDIAVARAGHHHQTLRGFRGGAGLFLVVAAEADR